MKFEPTKYLWIGSFIYLLINVIQSILMPLINDEAYYWAWSQRLDWGYFDHPPMVALWVKMGFSIFQSELGVRLITIVAGASGYFLLGKMLEIKTKNQFWLYTSLFSSFVLFQAFGFVTTPDSPLLFFGILYFIFLKKFLEKSDLVNALGLGLVMALLLYSKYHGVLLIIFSLLPLSLKLIRNKYFYISVLFGILCYSPHLWWQFENDFVSVQYHLVRRNVFNQFKISNTTDYLASLAWASSPLLFWFTGKALFKSKYKTDFQKALLWSFLGIVGFFILVTFKRYIQGQWSLLAFIPLLIITYNFFKTKQKDIKWIKILGFATVILMIVARIYFILPQVPFKTQYHGWKEAMKKAGEVTEGTAVFEKYQYTSLFKFNNFPERDAENFITIENRHSQYELWDSEASLEGKDITYFSRYNKADDSIQVASRDNEVFYYRTIKNFHTAYFLNLEILNYSIDDGILTGEIKVSNQGDFSVHLTEENKFELKQIYVEYPYSEQVKCEKNVSFDEITLEAQEQKTIKFQTEVCDLPARDYITYFGFVNQGVPPKIQSGYIEIKID